jgi:hypothetical protein
MNPNDDQPLPPDYLNQIAPTTPSRNNFFSRKPIFIGIGIIISLIVVLIIGSLVVSIRPVNTTEQMAARLKSVQDTAGHANANIKSASLTALNSNLETYLDNTIAKITPLLSSEKIDVTNLSNEVKSIESNKNVLAVLEDARLHALYDRTYSREMAFQLDLLSIIMHQVVNNSNDSQLKIVLDERISQLEPIQKQFADFNEKIND